MGSDPRDVVLDLCMGVCVGKSLTEKMDPDVEMWGLGEGDKKVSGVPTQGGRGEQSQQEEDFGFSGRGEHCAPHLQKVF